MSATCVSFRRLSMLLFAVLFGCACLAAPPVAAKEKKVEPAGKAEVKKKDKARKAEKPDKGKKDEEAEKEDDGEKVVIADEAALLTVLNKGDAKVLTAIPGVGKKLAESIVAARPYETLEDLLKVEGIAQKRLDRIKSAVGKAKVPAAVLAEAEE